VCAGGAGAGSGGGGGGCLSISRSTEGRWTELIRCRFQQNAAVGFSWGRNGAGQHPACPHTSPAKQVMSSHRGVPTNGSARHLDIAVVVAVKNDVSLH